MYHDLLTGLPEELLQRICLKRKRVERGHTVHEVGAPCESVDLVCSGRLVAYTLSETGNETVVFEFTEGAVLGANLLFVEHSGYPLTVYCEEDCDLIQIGRGDVEYLLRSDPDFVMRFIRVISVTSVGMNRRLTMYTQKTLRENILDYLRTLAAAQRSQEVVLPMTKKQMADYFGVRRPSLFRELKKMKDEGLIEVRNRIIRIETDTSGSRPELFGNAP